MASQLPHHDPAVPQEGNDMRSEVGREGGRASNASRARTGPVARPETEAEPSAPVARPILFSAPMIRALLDGRKTQTRRIVKPQPGGSTTINQDCETSQWGFHWYTTDDRGDPTIEHWKDLRCPYGVPGDVLWVREAWAHYHTVNSVVRSGGRSFSEVSDGLAGYRADGHDTIEDFRNHVRLMSGCDLEAVEINGDRWHPSIHMPRWASRISLRVTDVRVERLNEISETDAEAEGSPRGGFDEDGRFYENPVGPDRGTYRAGYCGVWEHINGSGSWEANPFVWAVSFTVERGAAIADTSHASDKGPGRDPK